jgi:hypothetical protein
MDKGCGVFEFQVGFVPGFGIPEQDGIVPHGGRL